ncbi:ribonuclease H-like domain-containing protein [Tanacetum coccineum]
MASLKLAVLISVLAVLTLVVPVLTSRLTVLILLVLLAPESESSDSELEALKFSYCLPVEPSESSLLLHFPSKSSFNGSKKLIEHQPILVKGNLCSLGSAHEKKTSGSPSFFILQILSVSAVEGHSQSFNLLMDPDFWCCNRIERYMENYKNVSQDIRDQLNAEAEAVQIILTGIDNDIYSIVDACPNAYEMWKAIERLKQGESINVQDLETNLYWEFGKFTIMDGESLDRITQEFTHNQKPSYSKHSIFLHRFTNTLTRNRGKAIVTSSAPTYDLEPATVTKDDEMSKKKELDKLMALISLSFKNIYKPTNNNLQTSSNTSRANQDNSSRINRGTGYDNQKALNVAGARENVGTLVVQKSGIQCYNCKEYGHVSRECQKPKRVKDAAYHKEKMLLCKQEEAGVQLNAEQVDWKDDTMNDPDDQNWKPIICTWHRFKRSLQIQLTILDQSLMLSQCIRSQNDQDDTVDRNQERDLIASLIEKLKCEIETSKTQIKFLESSNKA